MIYGPLYSQSLGGWYEYDDSSDTIYLLDATTRSRNGRSARRPSNIPIASLTNNNPPQPTSAPGPVANARQASASNPAHIAGPSSASPQAQTKPVLEGPWYSATLKGWHWYDRAGDQLVLEDGTRKPWPRGIQKPTLPQPVAGPSSRPPQARTIHPAPSFASVTVVKIRFTVHNTGQLVNSQCSDNHTSAYLLLSNNNAVQINMRTEPNKIDGMYEMCDRNYQKSSSGIQHFDYTALSSFNAQNVHDIIWREGFNEYTFTGGGIGCRFWKYDYLNSHIPGPTLTLPVLSYCAGWSSMGTCLVVPRSIFTHVCPSNSPARQMKYGHGQSCRVLSIKRTRRLKQSPYGRKLENNLAG